MGRLSRGMAGVEGAREVLGDVAVPEKVEEPAAEGVKEGAKAGGKKKKGKK